MRTPAHAEATILAAMSAPFGVGVIASDISRAKTALYAARKRLAERGIDASALTIRTSPENPAFELYILRDRTRETPQPATPDTTPEE